MICGGEPSRSTLRNTLMEEQATTTSSSVAESNEFDYRPVSKLALVCLVLGVVSGVALVTPALWIVPLITIGIGMMAWRSIARGERAGLWFAVGGITLASFIGAFAVGFRIVQVNSLKTSTRDYAKTWLETLDRGDINKAFQFLHDTKGDSKPPAQSYEEYYEDDLRRDALETFRGLAPVDVLLKRDGDLAYQRSKVVSCNSKLALVWHRFRFTYDDDEEERECDIDVYLIGELAPKNDTMEWYVGAVKSDLDAAH